MTKQELLTRLAMECATWDLAVELCTKIEFTCLKRGKAFNAGSLREHEWLAERDRILDKPILDNAPEGVTCMAMDKVGQWTFFNKKPTRSDTQWLPESPTAWQVAGFAYAIPAGYDWRESLEERPA